MANGSRVSVTPDELTRRITDHASIKDYHLLTGGDLQSFAEEFKARFDGQTLTANLFIDPEVEAFLWILTRSEDVRDRVYESHVELRSVMDRDLRRLNLQDVDQLLHVPVATSAVRHMQPVGVPDSIDDVTLDLLAGGGYTDSDAIASASDDELMQIKGIGRVRLHQIRQAQKAGKL